MSAIVIEHVKVSELPENWRARLHADAHARVTVRIEEEAEHAGEMTGSFASTDPAFGIWRDRDDMADVEDYSRKLRAPRFTRK